MAGDADKEDKTETASARRLQQAREAGQAPLSREVAGVAVVGAAAVLLSAYVPGALADSASAMARILAGSNTLDTAAAIRLAGRAVLALAWPFAAAAILASGLSVLGQTRFLLKTSALRPDFSKINPLSGFSRVFGRHNAFEAAKSLLKLGVMGAIGWHAIARALPDLRQALFWSPGLLAARIGGHLVDVAVPILGVQGAIAAVDILRTQLAFNSSMRMTRQEQRDEARDSEGDPHVKGRLKQIRMQRARRRMMQAVPQATVVVTNPTHYAVAVAYDRAAGGAPRIVAKGMDELAARIREVAREAGVPLVANPPLARALFPLPLDHEIPAEHFKAVAELIAYVWRLGASARRPDRAG